MAAPMMTIDLPCVLCAFSPNWRATVMVTEVQALSLIVVEVGTAS